MTTTISLPTPGPWRTLPFARDIDVVDIIGLNNGSGAAGIPGSTVNQASHTPSLTTQLAFAAGLGAVLFVIFCLLRFRWPTVYAPRSRLRRVAPMKLPFRFLGWLLPVINTSEMFMLQTVGLDAVMFLRFFKLSIAIFSVLAVPGLCILIPINVVGSDYASSAFLSMNAIPDSSPYLVPHLIFVYIFSLVVYYYLLRYTYHFLALRWHYLLRNAGSVEARSVMVTNIPSYLQDPQMLRHFFEELEIGKVEEVYIVGQSADLPALVRSRAKHLRKLEALVAQLIGNPCKASDYDRARLTKVLTTPTPEACHEERILTAQWMKPKYQRRLARNPAYNPRPTARLPSGRWFRLGPKVDGIDYHKERFLEYDRLVTALRKVRRAASHSGPSPSAHSPASPPPPVPPRPDTHLDHDAAPKNSSVGFVTFEHSTSAHIASQSLTHAKPFACVSRLAPEPVNVYWNNLTTKRRSRVYRTVLVFIAMALLTFFWGIPVAFLASFLSLDSLGKHLSFVEETTQWSGWVQSLFSYTLPSVVMISYFNLLPAIIQKLAEFKGVRVRAQMDTFVLSRVFFFQIFNVLLVFTLSSTLWNSLYEIIDNPSQITQKLASSLPQVAPFFINYIIMLGVGYLPFKLLQVFPMIWHAFRRYLCTTPRDFAEVVAPIYVAWGARYPVPMLVFVITLTYSNISPLILVFGILYFILGFVFYKYLFLYVYFKYYESSGRMWPFVVRRLVVCIYIYHLLMFGLFSLKKLWVLAILTVPTVAMNSIFFHYINKILTVYGDYVPLYLLRLHQRRREEIRQLKLAQAKGPGTDPTASACGTGEKSLASSRHGNDGGSSYASKPNYPAAVDHPVVPDPFTPVDSGMRRPGFVRRSRSYSNTAFAPRKTSGSYTALRPTETKARQDHLAVDMVGLGALGSTDETADAHVTDQAESAPAHRHVSFNQYFLDGLRSVYRTGSAPVVRFFNADDNEDESAGQSPPGAPSRTNSNSGSSDTTASLTTTPSTPVLPRFEDESAPAQIDYGYEDHQRYGYKMLFISMYYKIVDHFSHALPSYFLNMTDLERIKWLEALIEAEENGAEFSDRHSVDEARIGEKLLPADEGEGRESADGNDLELPGGTGKGTSTEQEGPLEGSTRRPTGMKGARKPFLRINTHLGRSATLVDHVTTTAPATPASAVTDRSRVSQDSAASRRSCRSNFHLSVSQIVTSPRSLLCRGTTFRHLINRTQSLTGSRRRSSQRRQKAIHRSDAQRHFLRQHASDHDLPATFRLATDGGAPYPPSHQLHPHHLSRSASDLYPNGALPGHLMASATSLFDSSGLGGPPSASTSALTHATTTSRSRSRYRSRLRYLSGPTIPSTSIRFLDPDVIIPIPATITTAGGSDLQSAGDPHWSAVADGSTVDPLNHCSTTPLATTPGTDGPLYSHPASPNLVSQRNSFVGKRPNSLCGDEIGCGGGNGKPGKVRATACLEFLPPNHPYSRRYLLDVQNYDHHQYDLLPDKYTDYTQSPMELVHGVLDSGIKGFQHPSITGKLPQLWLPMGKGEFDELIRAALPLDPVSYLKSRIRQRRHSSRRKANPSTRQAAGDTEGEDDDHADDGKATKRIRKKRWIKDRVRQGRLSTSSSFCEEAGDHDRDDDDDDAVTSVGVNYDSRRGMHPTGVQVDAPDKDGLMAARAVQPDRTDNSHTTGYALPPLHDLTAESQSADLYGSTLLSGVSYHPMSTLNYDNGESGRPAGTLTGSSPGLQQQSQHHHVYLTSSVETSTSSTRTPGDGRVSMDYTSHTPMEHHDSHQPPGYHHYTHPAVATTTTSSPPFYEADDAGSIISEPPVDYDLDPFAVRHHLHRPSIAASTRLAHTPEEMIGYGGSPFGSDANAQSSK
ncbi:hypothetical protein IWQ60_008773 [Tieghemiomyces parasiticus]|uniref:DUF221-domain-containing protein n=1 Tax=Tieghemiomyces parasiticus TaxID=78921 RepID=A0A9W7ZWF9_9FUNG|nr:hypothetical protein IWQ60_008773 [Tieghemiomyces parasiticus]